MSIFVDTSVWYAAVYARDAGHSRATAILADAGPLTTSSLVLGESWRLIAQRVHWQAAERFLSVLRGGGADIETVTESDLESAQHIGQSFPDQEFSLTDRTSFAIMQRRGIKRVASFDADFAVFRFGPNGRSAFEVLK